jgi:hypothetical protein
MKFPKHRANLYLVERWTYENNSTVIVGAFDNVVAADNFRDACLQEWIDRGLSDPYKEDVVFNVVLTTYYDE